MGPWRGPALLAGAARSAHFSKPVAVLCAYWDTASDDYRSHAGKTLTRLKSSNDMLAALGGGIVMRANLEKSPLLCDHCRGELRLNSQRYWHMRFCSDNCMAGYQARLSADTHKKILQLDVGCETLKMAS